MIFSKKLRIFICIFFSVNLIIPSFAETEINIKDKETSNEVKNEEQLSSKYLDHLWDNRESSKGEKEIIIPKDFNISWKISRLVYYYGNFIFPENLGKSEKTKIFKYGYESGEIAKQLEPKRVEGYF